MKVHGFDEEKMSRVLAYFNTDDYKEVRVS